MSLIKKELKPRSNSGLKVRVQGAGSMQNMFIDPLKNLASYKS